jgi:hypothetical protein
MKNRVPRRIFEYKGAEVARHWRNTNINELHKSFFLAKYYQDDQIREDEMSLACSMHRKEEK